MSENTEQNTAIAGEPTETTATEGQGFQAISSQEELDRIIQQRVARERNRFADYDELKAKADKLAGIEEAQKTEAEKTAERLAAAEQRAAELEAKALRAEVAAAKGVPVALLAGTTPEELEASADALIAFRGEQATPVPSSSALSRVNTTTAEPDFAAAIREAEDKRDFRAVISLKQQQHAAANQKG